MHAALADAYRADCPDGWASGRDDGYFFQQLPSHVAEAGDAKALRSLLFDAQWMQRKLNVAGITALNSADTHRFDGGP